MGTSTAAAVALAVLAPGCADPCAELHDQCGLCGDADYAAACRETVNKANQDVCQAQLGTYKAYCDDDSSTGGAGAGSSCNGVVCAGSCVDTNSDPSFCGSCVNSCDDSAPKCMAGSCVAECVEPFVECDTNSCVDTSTDPNNCGSCGGACSEGQLCSQGSCVDSCDPDSATPTECSGSCVSLANDPLNCGACGEACTSGEVCSAGQCADSCADGLTACCGKCVDTNSDPEHCGGCADGCDSGGAAATNGPCADGEVCDNGVCAASCSSGLEDCGGACVDLQTDSTNCGSCGTLCGSGLVCANGSCSNSGCDTGKTECSGSCVNLQNDPGHCGSCGNACGSGEQCSVGLCIADGPCTTPVGSSDADYQACDGSCVDLNSDPSHCGACNTVCTGSDVCADGTCQASCNNSETSCNGACVDLTTSFDNCGSCGTTCNDASVCTFDMCTSSACTNQSGAQACNDGKDCTTDTCDPVDGCQSENITVGQVLALCPAVLLVDTTTHCLFCNTNLVPVTSQQGICAAVPLDNFSCTEPCPVDYNDANATAAFDSDAVQAAQDSLCTTSCAGTCDPTDGNADGTTGCVEDDTLCTATCASSCDPEDGNADTTTGCVESDSQCTTTCSSTCDPEDGNADGTTGCVEDNSVCTALAACTDTCDPENGNADGTTGCVEDDNQCTNTVNDICDPEGTPVSGNNDGCCTASSATCN